MCILYLYYSMKLVLDNVALTEDFFEDTFLLGIMAPVRNYHFCWHLNLHLGYNFRLNRDINKELRKKKRDYYFEVYQHNENDILTYYIIHNHCDGEYLLPEVKHIDFIFFMKGDIVDIEKCNDIITSIKSIACVQMVVELSTEMLKNKGHLVF